MLQDDLLRQKNEGKAGKKILYKIEKPRQIKVMFKESDQWN